MSRLYLQICNHFSYPAEFEKFRISRWFLLLALILVLNIPKIKTERKKNLTAVTRKCAPISDHAD